MNGPDLHNDMGGEAISTRRSRGRMPLRRSWILVVALLSTLAACGDDFLSDQDADVPCATREGPLGNAPWGLDPAILPDDEPSIQSTLDEMTTLSEKYDLAFSFGPELLPICFSILRVDEDRPTAADGRFSEYHMGIEVPLKASGGYPGDTAQQFLKELAVRAGEAQIESRALERHDDLVYLTTTVHVPDEAPGQFHYGFAWGLADSPWVFVVDTFTLQERANVVRAFAEASRTVTSTDAGEEGDTAMS